MAKKSPLSHLDARDRPQMVDVGAKAVTSRVAVAEAIVVFPKALAALIQGGEINSKKGPVFQAAILAGIMGAKKTADLIPLCHPLSLDDCKVKIEAKAPGKDGSALVHVRCTAKTNARTGVEMEALTGATVAALTLYDMGKAVTHGILIRDVRLLSKTGGKSDYRAP